MDDDVEVASIYRHNIKVDEPWRPPTIMTCILSRRLQGWRVTVSSQLWQKEFLKPDHQPKFWEHNSHKLLVVRLRFWPVHDGYLFWLRNNGQAVALWFLSTDWPLLKLQSFNMWHATHYKADMHQWLHLHLQTTYNEQSLAFNIVALTFLFTDQNLHHSHLDSNSD